MTEQTYIEKTPTPFYLYNLGLLEKTLDKAIEESKKYNYNIHYALKANSNNPILKIIQEKGFGADCVSGNEVLKALELGFPTSQIVFAGVGKTDKEINIGLDNDIFSFNCESKQEIEVINQLAKNKNVIAKISLRINPNVSANTHKYITTGLEENKFGLNMSEISELIESIKEMNNIHLIGIHFHIGSQIKSIDPFKNLCIKANEINKWFFERSIEIKHLNLGGGLGVDYSKPNNNLYANFSIFFKTINEFLEPFSHQKIHFELGRSLVAHCGTLISKVLYIKEGISKNFAIIDAGMTELLRPALYQAIHHIENYTSKSNQSKLYDIVGPICESSDCFGKQIKLPITNRGDIIKIHSVGAYGETMSSNYNLRKKVESIYF